jgi:hypothetical protein
MLSISKWKEQAHRAVYVHVFFSGLNSTDQFPQQGINVIMQLMPMYYVSMTNVKTAGD